MQNLFDLSGRVALITGGSRGLGLRVLARMVRSSHSRHAKQTSWRTPRQS
jgi:hypothetical protein